MVFIPHRLFSALRSPETLRTYISRFAPYSHLTFFLLQLLSVVLAPIPSNVSALAGGLLFGTLALLFMVPVFFVAFQYLHERIAPKNRSGHPRE